MNFRGWSFCEWLAAAVALIMAFIVLAAVGSSLGVTWDWLGRNSSNIASWVQSVGSIAAIAAVFVVARFQLRETLRHQEEKEIAAEKQARFASSVVLIDAYENAAVNTRSILGDVNSGGTAWIAYSMSFGNVVRHFQGFDPFKFSDSIDIAYVTATKKQSEIIFESLKSAATANMTTERRNRLKTDLVQFIAAVLSQKYHAIEAAKSVATEAQRKSLDELLVLYDVRDERNAQGIGPAGISPPTVPQPTVEAKPPTQIVRQ